MKRALIVQGGWEGHDPLRTASLFSEILTAENFSVSISDQLSSFEDEALLQSMDLIVPLWTMGKLENEASTNVGRALESGVGMAGCHGGMCDAFRENTEWQFITGGQWVAHPGNDEVEYRVEFRRGSSLITEGLADFIVKTEQYYLHVDPAVEVLATTRFPIVDGPHAANGPVDMPVVWTKRWGRGKIFYCSLGHQSTVFQIKESRELMRRGFLWAAR